MAGSEESDKYKKKIFQKVGLFMIRHYLESTPARDGGQAVSSRSILGVSTRGFLPAGEALAKGQVASPAGRFFGLGFAQ